MDRGPSPSSAPASSARAGRLCSSRAGSTCVATTRHPAPRSGSSRSVHAALAGTGRARRRRRGLRSDRLHFDRRRRRGRARRATSSRRTDRSASTSSRRCSPRSTQHAPAGRRARVAARPACGRPTIQATCAHHPERVLVGHPFHPRAPHPARRGGAGEQTSDAAVAERRIGVLHGRSARRPIRVRQELAGPRREPAAGSAVAGGVQPGRARRRHRRRHRHRDHQRTRPALGGARAVRRASTSPAATGRASRTPSSTSDRRWSRGGTTSRRPTLTPELVAESLTQMRRRVGARRRRTRCPPPVTGSCSSILPLTAKARLTATSAPRPAASR